jgi:hypothetical protein
MDKKIRARNRITQKYASQLHDWIRKMSTKAPHKLMIDTKMTEALSKLTSFLSELTEQFTFRVTAYIPKYTLHKSMKSNGSIKSISFYDIGHL